jgi:hypothetical protein
MNKFCPLRQRWPASVTLAIACCAFIAIPVQGELLYVTLQTSVVSFDLSSGDGPTIAATKATVASGLTEAQGLVFDADGNLYVNNYSVTVGGGTVSKIVPGSGTATPFASGFTENRGITYSDASNSFYVSNSNSPGSISGVTSGGTVSTFFTYGSPTSPYGLALDDAGDLYSANNATYSISKIDNGVASAFATFTPGQGVRGVAVAPNGDVYSTGDFGLNVTTQGGTTTNLVSSSGFSFAFGVAYNQDGDLFVPDYLNQTVSAFDSSGTLLYSFSTGAGTANRPRYAAFDTPGSGINQIVPEPGSVATGMAALIVAGGYAARRRVRRMSQGSLRAAGR